MTHENSAVAVLLDAVDRIRPIIEEHAVQSEAQRALAAPVYDAMREAGLFRMLAPKAFGGLELHPTEAYRVWEALARIDSAAAWNLQISSQVSNFAYWLPKAGGEELFERGPDTRPAVDLVCEAAGTTAIRIEHGIPPPSRRPRPGAAGQQVVRALRRRRQDDVRAAAELLRTEDLTQEDFKSESRNSKSETSSKLEGSKFETGNHSF